MALSKGLSFYKKEGNAGQPALNPAWIKAEEKRRGVQKETSKLSSTKKEPQHNNRNRSTSKKKREVITPAGLTIK